MSPRAEPARREPHVAAFNDARTTRVAVVEGEIVAAAARGAFVLVEAQVLRLAPALTHARRGGGAAGDQRREKQDRKEFHVHQIVVVGAAVSPISRASSRIAPSLDAQRIGVEHAAVAGAQPVEPGAQPDDLADRRRWRAARAPPAAAAARRLAQGRLEHRCCAVVARQTMATGSSRRRPASIRFRAIVPRCLSAM